MLDGPVGNGGVVGVPTEDSEDDEDVLLVDASCLCEGARARVTDVFIGAPSSFLAIEGDGTGLGFVKEGRDERRSLKLFALPGVPGRSRTRIRVRTATAFVVRRGDRRIVVSSSREEDGPPTASMTNDGYSTLSSVSGRSTPHWTAMARKRRTREKT